MQKTTLSNKNLNLKTSILWVVGFIALTLVFAFFTTTEVKANEVSFGWFSPKVEYVSDTTSCPVGQSAIEIKLLEAGTTNSISQSSGDWHLLIMRADGTKRSELSYSSQSVSDPVCFDPASDGLRVKLAGNGDYHEIETPIIYPPAGNTDTNNMEGKLFRGYLELESKSSPNLGYVESVVDPIPYYSSDPEVEININSLPQLFSSTGIAKLRYYFKNQTTGILHVQNYDILDDTGSTIQSAPTGVIYRATNLPDGRYIWTFFAEGDGSSVTNKITSPPHTWTFNNLPSSGVPNVLSFTKDTTPPVANVTDYAVASINATEVDLDITFEVKDVLSGVNSASIVVRDTSDNSIAHQEDYLNLPDPTPSANDTIRASNLKKGRTYDIEIMAVDNAGNQLNSVTPYTVPNSFIPPQLELRHDPPDSVHQGVNLSTLSFSYARLEGVLTDKTTNPLQVTDLQICWSTSNSSLISTSDPTSAPADVYCSSNGTPLSYINDVNRTNLFYQDINNFTSDSTIYFQFFAKNTAGWGESSIGHFDPPDSPYNNPEDPTTPVINFIQPSNPGSLFLGLGIDFLRPGIEIVSAGNSEVDTYAICKFNNATDRDNFDMTNIDPAVDTNCFIDPPNLFGNSWDPTQPLPFSGFHLYQGLQQGTDYYFKIYLRNVAGYEAVENGQASTADVYYRFRHTANSVNEIITSGYNNGVYSEVKVPIIALDATYDPVLDTLIYLLVGNYREINYEAEIDHDNDGTPDNVITGTINGIRQGSTPELSEGTLEYVTFRDVPIGPVEITVTLNEPPLSYPYSPLDTDWDVDRVKSIYGLLTDPNDTIDSVAGNTDTSNEDLILDPNMNMYAEPNTIRSGEKTTIYWEAEDVDMPCNVVGPSGFSHSLSPLQHGTLNASGRREGSFETNRLYDSQIFRVTCTDISGTTYDEEARVNVIGIVQEI